MERWTLRRDKARARALIESFGPIFAAHIGRRPRSMKGS
jgi:hypothetical protein